MGDELLANGDIEHLKDLLKIHKRNLRQLELQYATYGGPIGAPLSLLNQIEIETEEIERLSEEVRSIESSRQQRVRAERFSLDPTVVELQRRLEQLEQERVADFLSQREVMELRPVFRGRGFITEENLCFVLMPFGDPDLQTVYEDHVRPMVEGQGLRCLRSDDLYSTRAIVEDIWEGINRAQVIIAELTGRNPNVFYELGICHTIGKEVIPITQSMKDVPFDLRHRRCIVYEYTPRGCKELEERLASTLEAVSGQP